MQKSAEVIGFFFQFSVDLRLKNAKRMLQLFLGSYVDPQCSITGAFLASLYIQTLRKNL